MASDIKPLTRVQADELIRDVVARIDNPLLRRELQDIIERRTEEATQPSAFQQLQLLANRIVTQDATANGLATFGTLLDLGTELARQVLAFLDQLGADRDIIDDALGKALSDYPSGPKTDSLLNQARARVNTWTER